MDSHQLTTHAKHLLIAAGVLVLVWFGASRYMETRIKLATIAAASAEKIKANEATAAKAQGNVTTAEKKIQTIDDETKKKLEGLQQQLNSKLDSQQIKQIVQGLLPGVQTVQAKDAAGNPLIAVADTQENRDKINAADVAFKSCRFNLDDCQQKQAQYLNIIDEKNTIIAAKQETINTQKDTIKELTRFGKGGNFWARTGRVAIPAGCGAAGAGLAAQGGIKPKGVAIAALASAATCALTVRF